MLSMKNCLGRPGYLNVLLAFFIVSFMIVTGFVGSAQQNIIDSDRIDIDESISSKLSKQNAEESELDDYEGQFTEVNSKSDNQYPEPLIPDIEPIHEQNNPNYNDDMDSENNNNNNNNDPETVNNIDLDFGNHRNSEINDNDQLSGMDYNEFGNALNYITDRYEPLVRKDESSNQQPIQKTLTSTSSFNMTIGTDSNRYPGQGLGYVYRSSSSTSYYSRDEYYSYNYQSSYERRGWAVFDLKDLLKFKGVSITFAQIIWRNDYRYRVSQMDFWSMKTIPYDTSTSSTAKGFYDEIGGSGSVKLMTNTFTGYSTSTNYDVVGTVTSSGLSWLNSKINAKDTDIAIGSDISKLYSTYTSGYVRCYDLRININFSFTGLPEQSINELTVADELSGYTRSSTNYDIGRVYTSGSTYRAYASWDMSEIKSLIPTSGPNGETVDVKSIGLRINSRSGTLSSFGIFHMRANPKSSSASIIYADAADGTKYISENYLTSSSPKEYEWDLGPKALDDFNNTLDGTPNFFALGFSQTSSNYMYSPKLIIEWKINYPPMHTLRLGADNPEQTGHAVGYSRKSGTSYYCYSQYRVYNYKSSSSESRGWMVFDLSDLNKWDGANVKSATIIVQNYYRYYIKDMKFTSLKTTPYNNPGSTIAKSVFTESSSTGNVIGSLSFPSTSDTTKYAIEIPLDTAAATSINNIINGTSKTKTFGMGMHITSIHKGYSNGYLYWYDARLEVTFTYKKDLESSQPGDGLAFGDDISGYIYKRTSASNRPYGYLYVRKSTSYEYRGYAQWDISNIQKAFDPINISKIKITKVSLRINHYRSTSNNINIYHMRNDVTSALAATLFTDCADGIKYFGPGSTASTYAEYEWDLGTNAVTDLQAAFEDNSPDYFGVGIVTTSTSGYLYDHEPKLVLEFKVPEPGISIGLVSSEGFEGKPTLFNASLTRNASGGTGSMYYLWDFDGDSVFDHNSTTPYALHTWNDDYVGKLTLKVVDTDAKKTASANFTVNIKNMNPKCNQTKGKISPQPAYESDTVTFSGYTVDDPGNDSWWYFWDFDNDGVYDSSGRCDGKTIPPVSWFYEDDHLDYVSLLIVDDDQGSTNITTSHKISALPNSGWTGYVYNYGRKYSSSSIYYRWSYTYDYQRGWAKIDLSEIPEGAEITKLVFKGTVAYNRTTDMVGVRLLKSDPTSTTGTEVFNEAGSGTRLFGFTASVGDKETDLTKWVTSTSGKVVFDQALQDGWLGLGFDFEAPTTYGYRYGYMRGYSYNKPYLEIEYQLHHPGCLLPLNVLNQPPDINCNNITLSTSELNEGEQVSINNISFCDPGNDTYWVKFVVGSVYESDWILLGDSRPRGGGGVVINEVYTGGSDWIELYNFGPDRDMTGWTMYCDEYPSQGLTTYIFPSFTLKQNTFVQIHETSGSNTATDLYIGQNIYWNDNGPASCVSLVDVNKDVIDYVPWNGYHSNPNPNVPTHTWTGSLQQSSGTDDIYRISDFDMDSASDWQLTTGSSATPKALNPGQTGKGAPPNSNESEGWGVYGPGCHIVNETFNVTLPDDHPKTGTGWDDVTVTIYVKDDDDNVLIPRTGIGGRQEPATVYSRSYYSYTRNNGRKVVVDSDYNIYSIYVNYQSSPYMVFVGKSSDNGETWEHYQVSNQPYFTSTQYYPTLTIDSKNVLHAVWRGYGSGTSYQIRYANSKDGGETWGGHYNVSTGYGYYPAVAVDHEDNVHIAWSGYQSSSPYKIFYINRTASGVWSKNVQVSNSVTSYMPDIIADSKGNVHISWYGYIRSSPYNIQHRVYLKTGTWSSLNTITTETSYSQYYPNLAMDKNDDLHLAWQGRDSVLNVNYNIMYSKFNSSTMSWGTKEYVTSITSGSPYHSAPSIAINQLGEIDIVHYGYQPSWSSPYVIHHAQKQGTNWVNNWNLYTYSTSYQYYPTVLHSYPNSIAETGFAFAWFDAYYNLRYWTSEDFEIGDPMFTDGIDFCNKTLKVNNVPPEIDLNATYTTPSKVNEQAPFTLHTEFEDPAAGLPTERFEYNISIKGGDSSGWLPVTQFKERKEAGWTELTLKPNAMDGKEAYIYNISSNSAYKNYNFGTSTTSYLRGYMSGTTNYRARSLIQWDLSNIPKGYNVSNATMRLYFNYKRSPIGTRTIYWHPITQPWIEGTKSGSTATMGEVNWNNQPAFNSSKIVSSYVWAYGAGWVDFKLDVDVVESWISEPNSNNGIICKFGNEVGSYIYGYYYTSDYGNAGYHPELVLEFGEPMPAILPRGIIEVDYIVPDDHPKTGTPFDLLDFIVEVRDDDLGSDYIDSNITVYNVPPEIIEGKISPEVLVEKPDIGIPEGTVVTLEGFEFDDVAYDIWSERDYGFNYSIDWGDGEVSSWNSDFVYPGETGPGVGGGSGDNSLETIWLGGNGQDGNMFDVTVKNDLIINSFDCSISSTGSAPMEVWYREGSYVGYETNSGAWTRHGGVTVTGMGTGNPTNVPLGDLKLESGKTYGLYVTTTGTPSLSYTNGANSYENDDLKITTGVGKSYPFGSTFRPRTWNGRIYYSLAGGYLVKDNVTTTGSTEFNNGRKIVMDNENNLYAVYVNGSSPTQIWFSNSSDLGETWTQQMLTKGRTNQLEPSITIDSKDVLHVVWRGFEGGYYNIRYSSSNDGGETWSSIEEVTTGTNSPTEHFAPAIAVDSFNMVHVTWFGRTSSNTAKYNIFYTNRKTTGTWSAVSMLTTNNIDVYNQYPSIAIDGDDNVHVIWTGQTGTASITNIQYMNYSSNTKSWSSVKLLSSSTSNDQMYPSFVIDTKDNIHIAWESESLNSQIQYIKWDASTSIWSSIEQISTNSTANNNKPSIGVDHRCNVYVLWYKDNPYQLMMKMFDGYYWTDELEMTNPDTYVEATNPSVLYSGEHGLPARGIGYIYTADNGTMNNVYWGLTRDFSLTDYGPWKTLPILKHLYRDDNPSHTEFDVYNLTVRIRDDDTGIGEWVLPVKVYNVWPTMDKSGLDLILEGNESGLYTPEIPFTDPGTGSSETWSYWLDVDNSETLTAEDIMGPITTTAEINGRTHGVIPPILAPFNDDDKGTISLYLYDDDIPSKEMYVNFSYKELGDGDIHQIRNPSTTSATGYNNGRKLVFDSSGTLYMVYRGRTSPYHIYVKSSVDQGKTWTPDIEQDGYQVTTSAHTYQYYPSIAIDSKDVLHVTWSGRDTSPGYNGYRIQYSNSADGGSTWGNYSVVAKSTTTCNFYYPSIAVDSKDKVHITWYGYNYATNRYSYNIRYINRTAAGVWSPITLVTNDMANRYHYYPSIAIDSKDNVHITWYGRTAATGTRYNIQYRMMDHATGTWGSIKLITSSSTSSQYSPNIVIDIKDNVHIVWYGYPSYYRIKHIKYDTSTSTWGSITEITDGSNYQYRPSIGTDQRGYVYVTWYGYPSPYKIYLTVDKGTGFSTPEIITSDSSIYYSSQYYPSIVGYGPNCYPQQGTAFVWSGYYRDPVSSTTSTPTMYYSTDDFWLGNTFEPTDSKIKFSYTTNNVDPEIFFDSMSMTAVVSEPVDIKFSLMDVGSDDLWYTYDFCNGKPAVTMGPFYNNGSSPDPYPSALNGTAPFEISQLITHTFNNAGTQYMNISIWDDDIVNGGNGKKVNYTLMIKVVGPKDMKEEAIELLEPLVPGRQDIIGYKNLTIEYLLKGPVTVMAYNFISQPPFGWELKHIYTYCDVNNNDNIVIDASGLPNGMFGQKVILKTYSQNTLISEVEIPTAYSCLFTLEEGQKFGENNGNKGIWSLTDVGEVIGTSYYHYSRLSREVESAMDDILFSINKDPRRGYGWWHSHWFYYCGNWYNRQLWIDDAHLDPEFGHIVFCQERAAVSHLMSVINNCIKPNGVMNITFRWTGEERVDIEVYRYNTWWIGHGKWQLMQTFNGTERNDTFTVDPDGPTEQGKLKPRIILKIHKWSTGELLDTVYIRTSGYWPLEVEPGNMYGLLEIMESNFKTNNGNVWRAWYGDWSWWDFFMWEASRGPCGNGNTNGTINQKDDCYDKVGANEEEVRICSNLTKIKIAIKLLVKADQLIAKVAYADALDFDVNITDNTDEFDFHQKMAKRYLLRGDREAVQGRPYRAISDYKSSWKNSILAVKWALKNIADSNNTEDPGDEQLWPDVDPDCPSVIQRPGGHKDYGWYKGPWWLWWYMAYGTTSQWELKNY
jgi:hypothetical protein